MPEELEQEVENLKQMCRLLEMERKRFLSVAWRRYSHLIAPQQFAHLMQVRFALPCNMNKIMEHTGLTSAGASIFVDKMVKAKIMERCEDPDDRRNVIVRFSPRAKRAVTKLEDLLNRHIYAYFADCSPEELQHLAAAGRLVNRILGEK